MEGEAVPLGVGPCTGVNVGRELDVKVGVEALVAATGIGWPAGAGMDVEADDSIASEGGIVVLVSLSFDMLGIAGK